MSGRWRKALRSWIDGLRRILNKVVVVVVVVVVAVAVVVVAVAVVVEVEVGAPWQRAGMELLEPA